VRYIHEHQQALNNKRLETIRSESDIEVIELSAEERSRFRELSMPVRETYASMVGERGRQLLDLLLEQVKQHQSQ
jgi:TRAP-type C4-dicarboxylate transport system substrate-binding protein